MKKIIACFALCMALSNPLCARPVAKNQDTMSWRDILISQDKPYVANYGWTGGLNEQLTGELYREYRRAGFNAIYRDDHDHGARLFLKDGYGFVKQTYFSQPDPVLLEDGSPLHKNLLLQESLRLLQLPGQYRKLLQTGYQVHRREQGRPDAIEREIPPLFMGRDGHARQGTVPVPALPEPFPAVP